jgi:hypothetical protein
MEIQGIGWAVKQMQNGAKVRRSGWNGKGQCIGIVPAEHWGMGSGSPFENWGPGDLQAWVGIRNAQGKVFPWNASQGDLLAIDYELAE